MEKDTLLIILSTCPDRDSAERLARALVEQGKAACVNILPGIRSLYRWQGRLESAEELLLLIKSNSQAYPGAERLIQQLHPYELPEIVAVPVENGLPAYLDWISENTDI